MSSLNAATRTWIYSVAVAAVPLLVGYGLVSADTAPLWLALIAAVLAAGPPLLAIRNVTPDPAPAGPDEDDEEDAVDLPDGGFPLDLTVDDD